MKNITVNCNGIKISNKDKICLIAGPCQLETEQHALDMAGKIKEITTKYKIGFIYPIFYFVICIFLNLKYLIYYSRENY